MSACASPQKAVFASKRAAKKVLRKIGRTQGRMYAYKCGEHWHLGHSNAIGSGSWQPQPELHGYRRPRDVFSGFMVLGPHQVVFGNVCLTCPAAPHVVDQQKPTLLTQAVHLANASVDGHSLPGGMAMVSLAPVVRLSKWSDQIFEAERVWFETNLGAPIEQRPDFGADEDDSWDPALQTLRFWTDHYRRVLDMQYGIISTLVKRPRSCAHPACCSGYSPASPT